MEKIMVYYHKESDILDVWLGNPEDESSCEEVGEGVILKKDKNEKVIGFEKLYVHKTMSVPIGKRTFPIEVVVN